MLHTCVTKFDVTENLKKNCKIFLELNKALQKLQTGVKQQLKGEREERGREEFRKQIKR